MTIKDFTLSRNISNPIKRNDLFLLMLLIASLSLNIYLGWNIKRLSGASTKVQNVVKISSGMTVQPITAMSLSGRQETIGYAGYDKPTVLYVFSPTCMWCERNAQNINAVAGAGNESFRFIGLSLDDKNLSDYVESHHLSFPVYKNPTPDSMQMLGLGPTPQTIVISPEGRVLKSWSGAYSASIQQQVEEFFNVRLPGLAPQKN